jgi:hypothetical protein
MVITSDTYDISDPQTSAGEIVNNIKLFVLPEMNFLKGINNE